MLRLSVEKPQFTHHIKSPYNSCIPCLILDSLLQLITWHTECRKCKERLSGLKTLIFNANLKCSLCTIFNEVWCLANHAVFCWNSDSERGALSRQSHGGSEQAEFFAATYNHHLPPQWGCAICQRAHWQASRKLEGTPLILCVLFQECESLPSDKCELDFVTDSSPHLKCLSNVIVVNNIGEALCQNPSPTPGTGICAGSLFCK